MDRAGSGAVPGRDGAQRTRHRRYWQGWPEGALSPETNRGEATKENTVADKGVGMKRWAAGVAALLQPASAWAQETYADPQGSSVIVSAVRWLEGTLLGTIATVVAVIAVASVGLLMLTGRINWRYGATVILGCFILFGAASIVAGIQSTASLGQ